MKHLFYTVLIVLILFIMVSCNNASKDLVNSWKVEEMEFDEGFSFSEKHYEVFKEFEDKASFVFRSNGTYSFDMVQTKQTGEWKYNKEKNVIETVADDGTVSESKVLELESDKLVLEHKDGSGLKTIMALVPQSPSE